ncbi:MAG: glutathione S-transferase family protein [Immundisolibacteraceae bacterium]|nr:glutathione S-transferase family protein [Immundisolibacteraceae bacterium]
MSKLIGAPLSPFVRKVRVYLEERGLPFESEPMVPGSEDPEFRKISPLGKIPGFVDGDFAVSDSSVIMAYLENKHGPALCPTAPVDLARALWFEEYGDSAEFELFIAGIFFPQVVSPILHGTTPDAGAIQASVDRLPEVFDYLETQINGEYLVGDQFTLADIGVVSPFVNLQYAGHQPDPARWPKLASYVAGILNRPSFQASMRDEAAMLQKMKGQ